MAQLLFVNCVCEGVCVREGVCVKVCVRKGVCVQGCVRGHVYKGMCAHLWRVGPEPVLSRRDSRPEGIGVLVLVISWIWDPPVAIVTVTRNTRQWMGKGTGACLWPGAG